MLVVLESNDMRVSVSNNNIRLDGECIMNYIKNCTSERIYQNIEVNDLIKNMDKYNDEDYIQISGVDIALRVSLLNNPKSDVTKDERKDLLQLYYDYLKQENENGYSSAYLETKFKNVRSILKKIFSNSYPQTFRVSS